MISSEDLETMTSTTESESLANFIVRTRNLALTAFFVQAEPKLVVFSPDI